MVACLLSQSIWPKRCTTSTKASPWTKHWFPTSPPLKSSTYSFTSRQWASSTPWLFCLRTLDAQALTTSSMMMATLMTSSSSLPSTQTLSTIETWLEEMDRNSALTWIGSTLREQVPSGTRLWRPTWQTSLWMASGPRTTRRTMIFKVRSWFLLTRPCSHQHQECCSRLAKTNLILLGTLLRVTIWTALISYLSSLFSQLLVHMISTQCHSTAHITDTAISKVKASLSTTFTRSTAMLWCKSPMTWCFSNLRRHLQSFSIRDPSLWLAQHSQALINMPHILLRASTGHGQLFRTQYLV